MHESYEKAMQRFKAMEFQFLIGKVQRSKEAPTFLQLQKFQFLIGKVQHQHFRYFHILLNQIFLFFATILSQKSVDRFSEIPDFP